MDPIRHIADLRELREYDAKMIAALRAERDRAIALLRWMEWRPIESNVAGDAERFAIGHCHVCGVWRPREGHAPDCEMLAIIGPTVPLEWTNDDRVSPPPKGY